MTQEEFLLQIAGYLETAGIPFMIAGSHSSSFHSLPRATNDVDIVIDPTPEELDRFLALLGENYYASAEAARDALRRRAMFNIIDFDMGWKADLIVRKNRPFSVEELARRQQRTVYGRSLPIASAEDVILSKLEWDKITPSERQIRDALNVATVQWSVLDKNYLQKWAADLGVLGKLEDLFLLAEKQQQP